MSRRGDESVNTVRVRFAPSPTGMLHVGSARTALFNWLYARQQGGTFVLRIEDTDTERNREEWVDGILDSLAWLGTEPDEGPYRQSARADRHRAAADALWVHGDLYACDCTRGAIEARTADRRTPGYDGFCRDRELEPGPGRALRFRVGTGPEVEVRDLIRGDVSFRRASIEDFVVVKSSGQPLFLLANAVDDRDMAISHVIRGEEHLPNTPKAILLWEALNRVEGGTGLVDLPVFAHLPLLVNERRQKLSKRRDPVAVERYRDEGYLPEAFRNYLASLGWRPPGDEEKVELETLIETFRLEEVNRAPAYFDVKKLTHLNGEYIRELDEDQFLARCRPWVDPGPGSWAPSTPPPWPPERFNEDTYRALAPLAQERAATFIEARPMLDFAFLVEPPIDAADWQKAVAGDEAAPTILSGAREIYRECPWQSEALKEATRALGERVGRKLGKVQAPIRVAVTGRTVGLPLFESLVVLGRDEVLRRIAEALHRLNVVESH
jgi:glutamyl-tRNA synthetase